MAMAMTKRFSQIRNNHKPIRIISRITVARYSGKTYEQTRWTPEAKYYDYVECARRALRTELGTSYDETRTRQTLRIVNRYEICRRLGINNYRMYAEKLTDHELRRCYRFLRKTFSAPLM